MPTTTTTVERLIDYFFHCLKHANYIELRARNF